MAILYEILFVNVCDFSISELIKEDESIAIFNHTFKTLCGCTVDFTNECALNSDQAHCIYASAKPLVVGSATEGNRGSWCRNIGSVHVLLHNNDVCIAYCVCIAYLTFLS